MKSNEITKAEKLSVRVARAEAKAEVFKNRSGPEKKSGEKQGEYRERIKRHEYVMERQVILAEFHRDRVAVRLRKYDSPGKE